MPFVEAGSAVNMSPNGEIVWHAYPTSEGTLYLPPDVDEGIAELFGRKNRWREGLGSGKYGKVYAVPEYGTGKEVVSKEFKSRRNGGTLSHLRANVTLAAGMEKAKGAFGKWEARSLAILGALVVAPHIEDVRSQWIMERLPKDRVSLSRAEVYDFPSDEARGEYYLQALEVYDGRPEHYFFDDQASNLHIARVPNDDGDKGIFYKFDIMAL